MDQNALKDTPCPTCGTKCIADKNVVGNYEYYPVVESQEKIDSDHILIKQLENVNRIETEANEKLRKGYHRLVKDNRKLKSLLKKVFEAMPSESDFGTDLCNEIKSVL